MQAEEVPQHQQGTSFINFWWESHHKMILTLRTPDSQAVVTPTQGVTLATGGHQSLWMERCEILKTTGTCPPKVWKLIKKLFRVSKSSICFLESCAMIISITPCHSLWRKHSAQSLPAMARCRSCQAPLEPRLKPRPNSKPWNWSMENLWTHN